MCSPWALLGGRLFAIQHLHAAPHSQLREEEPLGPVVPLLVRKHSAGEGKPPQHAQQRCVVFLVVQQVAAEDGVPQQRLPG
eukprot:CAMPEP_0173267798 /NCGR_PEP_ID=MMETSP1142-20121109/29975_1 /TAXON_ID=483371 /ORGANISM="non described non described, Strain CCMP2298" /LENGTH=80 /DNA_ID=CAMNT_0014203977 /DNA_START=852 /DNA_END=1094 /DNA_ORIENTATION=+